MSIQFKLFSTPTLMVWMKLAPMFRYVNTRFPVGRALGKFNLSGGIMSL